MITIRTKDVLEKARPHILDNTIGAVCNTTCSNLYRDHSRCVVGYALPRSLAKQWPDSSFTGLYEKEYVTTVDEQEKKEIEELQRWHDAWASGKKWPRCESGNPQNINREEGRRYFIEFFNSLCRKYGVEEV